MHDLGLHQDYIHAREKSRGSKSQLFRSERRRLLTSGAIIRRETSNTNETRRDQPRRARVQTNLGDATRKIGMSERMPPRRRGATAPIRWHVQVRFGNVLNRYTARFGRERVPDREQQATTRSSRRASATDCSHIHLWSRKPSVFITSIAGSSLSALWQDLALPRSDAEIKLSFSGWLKLGAVIAE